ncbi:hypothetical protein Tco_1387511, partial [Tanacetum coccineum]
SVPSRGLYKTKPPSPKVIKSLIQIPRQGQETRTKNKKTIIIGHRDHVSACLYHMLYCIETSTPYNLSFFILKRMEKNRYKPKELLPYGMLLTRGGSIAGRGGGSLAKCLIELNDGLGGGGFVVVGGSCWWKVFQCSMAKCSMESNDGLGGGGFVVVGGRCSSVRAGRGEVMGGGVDFEVSRSLLGEILEEIMGDKVGEEYGREEFRVDGGAVW